MPVAKPKKKRGVVRLLTPEETVAAHLYIKYGHKRGPGEIARELEMTPEAVKAFLKQTHVAAYLQSYRDRWLKVMAQYELSQVTKFHVTREDVIGRLLALSLTPPDETKGTIEGQVAALNAITEILGLKFSPRDADAFFKGKTPKEIENYALYGSFKGPNDDDPSEPSGN